MYHDFVPLKEVTYEQFLALARNKRVVETFPDIKKRLLLCAKETNILCEDWERMTWDSSSAYRVSPGREDTPNPLSQYEIDLWNKSQTDPLRVKVRKFICRILAEEFKNFDLAVQIEFLMYVEDCDLYDNTTIKALFTLAKKYNIEDYESEENEKMQTYYLAARTLVMFPFFDVKKDGGLPYIKPLRGGQLIKASEEVVIEQFTIRMLRQLMSCILNLCMMRTVKELRLGKLEL